MIDADANAGHYRAYETKRFRADRLQLIELIDQIVRGYEAQGYQLTVRQIYYQLVSHHDLPNKPGSYDLVQSAVSDGRMAGMLSWTAIEDRGRNLMGLETQTTPAGAFARVRRSYRRDLWAGQYVRPEVWIEKQALEGVIAGICNAMRVDFYATKGYNSQSEQWRAGQRFARRMQKGQRTVVIHLGDHDPSGVDMTRDNQERLSLFAGHQVVVRRVALNMDQVESYRLPDNPDNRPKPGDSRTAAYVERYGLQGWELDALEPSVIAGIIEREVTALRDPALWDEALAHEAQDLRELDEALALLGGDDREE